jgi:hypothetical protein
MIMSDQSVGSLNSENNLMESNIDDCVCHPSFPLTMPPKDYTKLTEDEAVLLPVAARLVEIVKQYVTLSDLSDDMRYYWNKKVGSELVHSLWDCKSVSS